jgi:hypothetical protein
VERTNFSNSGGSGICPPIDIDPEDNHGLIKGYICPGSTVTYSTNYGVLSTYCVSWRVYGGKIIKFGQRNLTNNENTGYRIRYLENGSQSISTPIPAIQSSGPAGYDWVSDCLPDGWDKWETSVANGAIDDPSPGETTITVQWDNSPPAGGPPSIGVCAGAVGICGDKSRTFNFQYVQPTAPTFVHRYDLPAGGCRENTKVFYMPYKTDNIESSEFVFRTSGFAYLNLGSDYTLSNVTVLTKDNNALEYTTDQNRINTLLSQGYTRNIGCLVVFAPRLENVNIQSLGRYIYKCIGYGNDAGSSYFKFNFGSPSFSPSLHVEAKDAQCSPVYTTVCQQPQGYPCWQQTDSNCNLTSGYSTVSNIIECGIYFLSTGPVHPYAGDVNATEESKVTYTWSLPSSNGSGISLLSNPIVQGSQSTQFGLQRVYLGI